jgi:hypothetical protein
MSEQSDGHVQESSPASHARLPQTMPPLELDATLATDDDAEDAFADDELEEAETLEAVEPDVAVLPEGPLVDALVMPVEDDVTISFGPVVAVPFPGAPPSPPSPFDPSSSSSPLSNTAEPLAQLM